MNTNWWKDEPCIGEWMARAGEICLAALPPGRTDWVVCHLSTPLNEVWTQTPVCPAEARAAAMLKQDRPRQAVLRQLLSDSSGFDSWLSEQKSSNTKCSRNRQPILIDTTTALALCALSFPVLRERSHRQGVTAIHIGEERLTAFLVFKARLFGIFEHHSAAPVDLLLNTLREFRLGWLPDELLCSQGGYGSALMSDMPAEAEGFVPTYLFGPRENVLAGYGRPLISSMSEGFAECMGLLYGLATWEAAESRQR